MRRLMTDEGVPRALVRGLRQRLEKSMYVVCKTWG